MSLPEGVGRSHDNVDDPSDALREAAEAAERGIQSLVDNYSDVGGGRFLRTYTLHVGDKRESMPSGLFDGRRPTLDMTYVAPSRGSDDSVTVLRMNGANARKYTITNFWSHDPSVTDKGVLLIDTRDLSPSLEGGYIKAVAEGDLAYRYASTPYAPVDSLKFTHADDYATLQNMTGSDHLTDEQKMQFGIVCRTLLLLPAYQPSL